MRLNPASLKIEHRVNPEPYVDIVLLSDDYKLPDKVNV
jgi:hypothetical protein